MLWGGGLRRRSYLGTRGWVVVVSVLVVAVGMIVPLGVYAVQNIFVDNSQIVDIQVGSDKIDQVYVGSTLVWERAPQLNFIQEITMANCPTARTMAVDARDNATYWVQKLADGKCWMLTNLAYGGGGINTYNDTKTIINSNSASYTDPFYYIPAGSNRTVEPQDPSVSTTGTGQYGYLYNWCAAMGGQIGTSACMNAITPAPDVNVSICPAGWRLPTGNAGGEYQALNMAVNGGSISSPAGLLSTWLGMYGSHWLNGFIAQGSYGRYWSSTVNSATVSYSLGFELSVVRPLDFSGKNAGCAVRCVAI